MLVEVPKITKILYTTDLSTNSTYVFRFAMNMCIAFDAKMAVMYVMKPYVTPGTPESLKPDVPEDETAKMQKYMKQRLDDFVKERVKDTPALLDRITSVQVAEGQPAFEILKKADESNFDILVMGSHSKDAIAQSYVGSTVRDVLHRSRVPVMIVPIPKKWEYPK
ncbi:MAG: universal stress protein [Smithellaceae bacterium]